MDANSVAQTWRDTQMLGSVEFDRHRNLVSGALGSSHMENLIAAAKFPSALSAVESFRAQEMADRQKMFDQAVGRLNALPELQASKMQISGVTGTLSDLASVGNVIPQHIKDAVRGLPSFANGVFPEYGVVSAKALATVALEERFGLQDVHSVAAAFKKDLFPESVASAYLKVPEDFSKGLRLAQQSELAFLAAQTAHADRLAAYAFADVSGIASLAQRMGEMRTPWLSTLDSLKSATAFAHLQAIGDIVGHAPPYATSVGAWLRTGLGDWRDTITLSPQVVDVEFRTSLYAEHGVDLEIADSPPKAFVESAFIAKLIEADVDLVNDWVSASDEELAHGYLAFKRLQRFESAIRDFIVKVMEKAFGHKWMRSRLPNGMLNQWNERREIAKKAGEQEYALIAYADFTDYLKIIERGDNWRDVFAAIFDRKENVKESLQRLYPLRLATMHCRVITSTDLLFLFAETKRMYIAFAKW